MSSIKNLELETAIGFEGFKLINFYNYSNRLLISACFFMYVLRLYMDYMHQKSMCL